MSKFVTNIDYHSFESEVIKNERPVLVSYFVHWNSECRSMSTIIAHVAEELFQQVKFVKVDVDENPMISETYTVRSLPAVLLFKDGDVIAQKTGKLSKPQLIAFIQETLAQQ